MKYLPLLALVTLAIAAPAIAEPDVDPNGNEVPGVTRYSAVMCSRLSLVERERHFSLMCEDESSLRELCRWSKWFGTYKDGTKWGFIEVSKTKCKDLP